MNLIRYIFAETICRAVPFLPFNPMRKQLLRLCGLNMPSGVKVLWGCRFYNVVNNGFKNLVLGSDVYISENCFFDLTDRIVVGDRATLSFGVRILTHGDPVHSHLKDKYPRNIAPVVIEQDAWVCAYAMLLPGVRIGRNSVVAAGSVVTKDVPEGSFVAGVPAEVKRHV